MTLKSYPPLPLEMLDYAPEVELDEMWKALLTELINPAWSGRTHYNRKTYDAGCKGPMCRKAAREYSRRRNSTIGTREQLKRDAILDYWFPEAKAAVEQIFDDLLSQLS